jgi:hypothetical protein
LGLFRLLEQVEDCWRMGVFRGEAGFDPKRAVDIRYLFEMWSDLSDPMLWLMKFYTQPGLDIGSEADELATCTQRVYHVLTSWQPVTLSKAKALRIRYVTRGEADALGLPTD